MQGGAVLHSGAVRGLACALMVASGFAALGYQIVWTQQATLWLGHEAAAVLAVVAAFFGGLAVGALALGGRIARSRRPAAWYAGCEGVVAGWACALVGLMPWASGALLDVTGARPSGAWQWSVAFGGTFLLLLPATAAMGATLPAMDRLVGDLQRRAGASLAALYAANTFGALLGVLATAFWLVPAFGLARTGFVCIGVSLACAAAAALLPSGTPLIEAPPGRRRASRPLAMLAATGALGIGYEVLVVRVLSQVAENTVYTYALLLAVYLVSSAAGAAVFQRCVAGHSDPDVLRDRLLATLAAACLLGTASLWGAEALKEAVGRGLGPGFGSALAGEAAIAVAAFLLPSAAMGALFSHLATQARARGVGFGRALGVNTLGAAAAPFGFGVLLLPAVGPKAALLVVAGSYLVLVSPRRWRSPRVLGAAAALLALGVLAPPLAFVDVPEGGRVVSVREGATATVSVVEDARGIARLRIDNRQQEGDSASRPADARQALLPLLLHPAPRRALFLGLGTGVTAASAAEDPALQVDAVELLPDVIAASAWFTRGFGDGPQRLHTVAADARRFVRAAGPAYDVIVADNFHPARSGSGALYTVEHFRAVRGRLAEGGIFCQWLPLHQLDLVSLRSIVRSFLAVYPDAAALLATNSLETPVLGLVARAGGTRFDAARARERVAAAAPALRSREFGIDDEFALLGSFVAGPRSLAAFGASADFNTDDRPVVAYRAPRLAYAPDSRPRDRLMRVLRELRVEPRELDDGPGTARLAAYRTARNRFLEVGRDVEPSSDLRRMLEQVREPLLGVLRISSDFRPAYDPLFRMATALAPRDADAARALMQDLVRLQPARPEAPDALQRLAARRPVP